MLRNKNLQQQKSAKTSTASNRNTQINVRNTMPASNVYRGKGSGQTGRIIQSADRRSIRAVHREYVEDVTNLNVVSSKKNYIVYSGNGTLFTWLSIISPAFERFRLVKMTVQYQPLCGTASNGSVVLAWDPNAKGSLSSVTYGQVMSWQYAREVSVFAPTQLTITGREFVRGVSEKYCSPTVPTSEFPLYSFGNIIAFVNNTNVSGSVGRLYVDYVFDLINPKSGDTQSGSMSDLRFDASTQHFVLRSVPSDFPTNGGAFCNWHDAGGTPYINPSYNDVRNAYLTTVQKLNGQLMRSSDPAWSTIKVEGLPSSLTGTSVSAALFKNTFYNKNPSVPKLLSDYASRLSGGFIISGRAGTSLPFPLLFELEQYAGSYAPTASTLNTSWKNPNSTNNTTQLGYGVARVTRSDTSSPWSVSALSDAETAAVLVQYDTGTNLTNSFTNGSWLAAGEKQNSYWSHASDCTVYVHPDAISELKGYWVVSLPTLNPTNGTDYQGTTSNSATFYGESHITINDMTPNLSAWRRHVRSVRSFLGESEEKKDVEEEDPRRFLKNLVDYGREGENHEAAIVDDSLRSSGPGQVPYLDEDSEPDSDFECDDCARKTWPCRHMKGG